MVSLEATPVVVSSMSQTADAVAKSGASEGSGRWLSGMRHCTGFCLV